MKVLIQWATATPTDWLEYDLRRPADVHALPWKPAPVGGEVIDDEPGWLCAVNVQGVIYRGEDHLAFDFLMDRLVVHSWVDDLDDYPTENRYAMQWIFADPGMRDGQMNTNISRSIWAEPGVPSYHQIPDKQDYADFPIPDDEVTRHGIWLSDELFQAHDDARTHQGWRDWLCATT